MPSLKRGECLRGKRQKGRDRKIDVEKETEAHKGHRDRKAFRRRHPYRR